MAQGCGASAALLAPEPDDHELEHATLSWLDGPLCVRAAAALHRLCDWLCDWLDWLRDWLKLHEVLVVRNWSPVEKLSLLRNCSVRFFSVNKRRGV